MNHDNLPICDGCGISHTGPQDKECQVILLYKDGTQEYGWQALARRGPIGKTAATCVEVVH